MNIVIAPGSFKGSIKSIDVAQSMAIAIKKIYPKANITLLPLADGGEGTLEIFHRYIGGKIISCQVSEGKKQPIIAKLLVNDEKILIETSQVIGLSLISQKKLNPFSVSSYNVGQLILKALEFNPKVILIGMGDSSTMDAGVGMLAALGAKFSDKFGKIIEPRVVNLPKIVKVDLEDIDNRIFDLELVGLADTFNSLCGGKGHVANYGKQKGLKESDIEFFTNSFEHFGKIIEEQFGQTIRLAKYTSCSGGLGAALKGVLKARMIYTLDYVNNYTNHRSILNNADIVVTGEGQVDYNTRFGKVPYEVMTYTNSATIVITGNYTSEGIESLNNFGNYSLFCLPIQSPLSLKSMSPENAINLTTYQVFQMIHNLKNENATTNHFES